MGKRPLNNRISGFLALPVSSALEQHKTSITQYSLSKKRSKQHVNTISEYVQAPRAVTAPLRATTTCTVLLITLQPKRPRAPQQQHTSLRRAVMTTVL
jgi:hypothetical protein